MKRHAVATGHRIDVLIATGTKLEYTELNWKRKNMCFIAQCYLCKLQNAYTHSKQFYTSQSHGFSNSHVWMWELDHKESWAPKNWCFRTVVLEKTLECLLDCKEIQPVHPKGNQSCIFIGRTDAEAPILWPPDEKNWLIWKDPDAGKDWRLEEKGTTKGEIVGWHHWLDGHEFEQAPRVSNEQEVWHAAVHGVTKSWTWMNNWTELKILQRYLQIYGHI